ncbi:MAG: hypothetical protein HRS57_03840 [Mycoplasmataceae bacterium]|nr:hypothetical protein [Mycoplasmataceae bacterium]
MKNYKLSFFQRNKKKTLGNESINNDVYNPNDKDIENMVNSTEKNFDLSDKKNIDIIKDVEKTK